MTQDATSSLVGTELDKRYRIVSPLGQGGMGAVFRGEHVRIGRQVAIKVLNAELASSDDFLERFEREAIAAGRLDHPNCVPVTDSGLLDDGTAYMVMELVAGESLGDALKREGSWVNPVRALKITRHVLRGLGHAHEMGIVHRDIKPDNIMLCERENDREFARVLDFGIAKLRDDDSKEKEALTQAGVAVGTPAYLSPEQALGDTIDPRSDLYSCSVVLFEMLCGRPPFEAKNPIGILTKHASEPPPELWDCAPHLEEWPFLNELVQRGLAKERDQRFQTAAEFVQAVDYCLGQLGAQLTPVPNIRAISHGLHTGQIPQQRAASVADAQQTAASVADAKRAATAPTAISDALSQTSTGHSPTILAPRVSRSRLFLRRAIFLSCAAALITLTVVLSGGSSKKDASDEPSVLLQTHEAQLRAGKTCKERLAAVQALRALGDSRAIPALKKARRRMRGGVLGVAKKNTNRCLVKEANAALEELREP